MKKYNVAEAKRKFSDLLGRVAYGRETITITRRGKPIARLVPIDREEPRHLSEVEGWLDDDDPFFEAIEEAMSSRSRDPGRALDLEDE